MPNRPDDVLVLSTGGTFNKYYDPVAGLLRVDPDASAIRELCRKMRIDPVLHTLIGKDSLEMNDADREEILRSVREAPQKRILVIHGTDTMDRSAARIAEAGCPKRVVFSGAMVPYAVDPVEAAANFALALGFLIASEKEGVFIAMHGIADDYRNVVKDRKEGLFRFVQSPEG